jgi:hypothetical protein
VACFITPAVTSVIISKAAKKIPKKYHIEWLNTMLWGGVTMLAVEHIAHKEIVPYPPFLSAMQNPSDIPVMLKEMATVGGAMTLAIVMTWIVLLVTSNLISIYTKKQTKTIPI